MVGAERFELSTPGPPDRCANRAALRSDAGLSASWIYTLRRARQGVATRLWLLLRCAKNGAAGLDLFKHLAERVRIGPRRIHAGVMGASGHAALRGLGSNVGNGVRLSALLLVRFVNPVTIFHDKARALFAQQLLHAADREISSPD